MIRFLNWMFGCHHRKLSRVWLRRINGKRAGHYVVCLDCGAEFTYSGTLAQVLDRPAQPAAMEISSRARA